MTAQITALEGQITTIKKESKQYLKALKKTQADEVQQYLDKIQELETKVNQDDAALRELVAQH